MKIIKNKFIPFGSYKTINLLGLVFTKSDLSDEDKNHEKIHSVQILECAIFMFILILIIGLLFNIGARWLLLSPLAFYAWYGIEYLLIRVLNIKDKQTNCYHDVSFEEEAYNNDDNLEYLKSRKWFSWLEYIKIGSYGKTNS